MTKNGASHLSTGTPNGAIYGRTALSLVIKYFHKEENVALAKLKIIVLFQQVIMQRDVISRNICVLSEKRNEIWTRCQRH